MSDLNRASLESAFHSIQQRMVRLVEYATTAAPAVAQDPRLLPELADSVVVLVVARLDGFFNDLVSLGTRYQERTVGSTSTRNIVSVLNRLICRP